MIDVALGIDIGTSGVRIAAVDRNGSLAALSAAPIVAPLSDGGRILQDPAIWWQAVVEAMKGLDLAGKAVKTLAVDGTSGTILAIARDGTPQGLASMYNDIAAPGDLARVAAVAPQETAALGSTSPLARALPMQAEGLRIIHQADWIAARFSGRFDVSDENNALKSGYDPLLRSWPKWIGQTGFDATVFPEVVAAGTRTGTITKAAAEQFNLPGDVAIAAGTTDGCAAFLASGAALAGDGVTSLGTTLTLKLLSGKPVFAPQYGIYSYRIGEQWLAGGASNSGGVVIGRYFSMEEVARLTPQIDPEIATGLDYYPLPKAGERFPINDPQFTPKLTPRPEDDRVFLQAILEGIAKIEALGYRRLAELGASPLTSIRTVGGGAANAAWTKIRLKTLSVPEKSPQSEQAAAGTARLAWRGIGHVY